MNRRMIAVTPSGRSSNPGALERARGVSIHNCLPVGRGFVAEPPPLVDKIKRWSP
jgi:hypothetical protein